MKGDRIAIGLPAVNVAGMANAGQVAVYARQPDDAYTQEHLFTAAGEANLKLGLSVDIDATHAPCDRVVAARS